jgi:hypothetical protein
MLDVGSVTLALLPDLAADEGCKSSRKIFEKSNAPGLLHNRPRDICLLRVICPICCLLYYRPLEGSKFSCLTAYSDPLPKTNHASTQPFTVSWNITGIYTAASVTMQAGQLDTAQSRPFMSITLYGVSFVGNQWFSDWRRHESMLLAVK